MLRCKSRINQVTTQMDSAHKIYISDNFKGAFFEYKGVLHWEGHDYENFWTK